MLSPMDAEVQTYPLNNYLKQVKEPFICTGDFNIKGYRMNYWFPKYTIENIKSTDEEIDCNSIIYTEKNTKKISDFGDVDHILLSNNFEATAEYNWEFINDHAIYPEKLKIKRGEVWDICPPFPDHAMMISHIEIINDNTLV